MIFVFAADSYKIRTPRERFHTNNLNMRRSYFRFRLKGCQDSYVDFLGNAQDKESTTYALHIGEESNSRTKLYRVTNGEKTQVADSHTPDILHCDVMRQFWVTFDKRDGVRHMMFGEGWDLEQSTLLHHQDHDPASITGLTMGTNMGTEHAYWEFDRYSGK